MPELPEVETTKNELYQDVLGRRITGVTLLWEGIVRDPNPDEFRSRVIGQTITGLSRRGKYLIFGLSSGDKMIIHMKLTGSLLLKPASSGPEKFARAIIHLEGGTDLLFRDSRKFGVIKLAEDEQKVTGKLGPEPLTKTFTADSLARILAGRKTPVKAILLDQEKIAGIGNMYADEALFLARIHPCRSGESLTPEEIKRLHRAINKVLRLGITSGGASVEWYVRPGGEIGLAHTHFQVAHRRGKTCPRCGTPLQRIVVRGRGTYICPVCQPDTGD